MTLNVLVAGAHGRVGTAIRSHLGDRDEYEFTYLDIDDHPDVDTAVADITADDEMRSAFEATTRSSTSQVKRHPMHRGNGFTG